jgi:hypothetical protein
MGQKMNQFSILEIQAFVNQLYGGRPVVITPYGYTATFTDMTAGATQTQSLSITANADFILTGIKARTSDAVLQTISNKNAPYYRLLIVDSGSNEQFTNSAVDLENFSSNGNTNGNGRLPYPRFIGGRTALTLTLTSYTATAGTASCDVFLEGVLCRTYSGA